MYKEDARFQRVWSAVGGMVVGRDTSRFNEKEYAASLEAYTDEYRELFKELEAVCSDYPKQTEEILASLCGHLVDELSKDAGDPGRHKGFNGRALRLDTCKMLLLTYVTPAVFKMETGIGEAFNRCLHDAWLSRYPKEPYEVVTEEMITAGFGRRWYQCYITQAVCTCLGREDDCCELNAFRRFRDTYLRACEDGEALIAEYYRDAPGIVTRIEMSGRAAEVYSKLWQTYLLPCLEDIENGRPAACKERYVRMMRGLQREWLGNAETA